MKEEKHCYFCTHHIDEIDYKNVEILRRFISPHSGRILSRKKRGTCAKHQRKLSRAIKRARIMALLPFVKK